MQTLTSGNRPTRPTPVFALVERILPVRRIIPCIGIALAVSAAEAQEPVGRDMIARIKAEGLDHSRVLASFDTLTNVFGPRLTATPAFKRSADWVRARLEEWGMDNAHLESWEFGRGWTLEKFTLEMIEPRYFPMIGYPEAWTPSTPGEIVGAPVFLGDKTAEELRALENELRGSIVLSEPIQPAFIREDRPQPTEFEKPVRIGAPPRIRADGPVGFRELPALVRGTGAAVELRPNQGAHGTLFVLGRDRGRGNEMVPSVIVSAEQYNMVARMVHQGVAVRLRVNVETRYHEDDTNGYNIIAEIPGSDPDLKDEVVMFGAHLDSWHSGTGGTDNADGVAAAIEAMRILKAVGANPRRTIRVGIWGGEEQGLHGSRQWVARHLEGDANREAREKFSVYFNQDIGKGSIYGFYMEENDEAKAIFDTWLEQLQDIGARRNVSGHIGSSDHMSFIRGAGVPAFSTLQDYVDYDVRTHHTNMDTYERLTEADLQQSAIVLATFAYLSAMRDEKIPRGLVP